MLVLGRKRNEKLLIQLPDGRVLEIIPVFIEHGNVRIGINAPNDVRVYRDEIAPDNMRAATSVYRKD